MAAAEYRNGRGGKLGRAPENPFEFPESLVEQFGTPEMLLKDLKMAKREIETLKNQLEVKEKSVANYRAETTKLRKENADLKREVNKLREKAEV